MTDIFLMSICYVRRTLLVVLKSRLIEVGLTVYFRLCACMNIPTNDTHESILSVRTHARADT